MDIATEYIKKHILAITISVLGFLSAIVTLFTNVEQTISIKWLIFVIFISLVLLVVLIGIIIEFLKNNLNIEDVNQLKLVDLNKRTAKGEVYLNKSSINFAYGDVVKVYYLDKDEIEQFIGIGIIEHVQKQQNICHIYFLFKSENNDKRKEVYFSLKINKDELKLLMEKE
ncbi:MAG: hypothetical protein WC665_04400 [Sulfurimonas sp.]|jgi:hypothetical protein